MVKFPELGKKFTKLINESDKLKRQKNYSEAITKLDEAKQIIRDKIKNFNEQRVEFEKIKSMTNDIHLDEIEEVVDQGNAEVSQSQFSKAVETLNKALELTRNIDDVELMDREEKKIRARIREVELKITITKGNQLVSAKDFDEALKYFNSAMDDAKNIYGHGVENEETLKIKEGIENVKAGKIQALIEKGSNTKSEGNYDVALKIYEDAIKQTENLIDQSKRDSLISEARVEINELYADKIEPLIENCKSVVDDFDGLRKVVKEVNGLLEKMIQSSEKDNLNKTLADLINPIYLEKINPLLNEGKNTVDQSGYEKLEVIMKAVDSLSSAYELADEMAQSPEKESKVSEISPILNKSCSAGIKIRKDKGMDNISVQKFQDAIGEMYSAMSLARKMAGAAEEDNEEIKGIKDFVNKVYIAEIGTVIEKGNNLIEQQKYDEAIEVFNEALNISNKMYVSDELDQEASKIKSLIYQVELKKMVADGNISAEQQRFVDEVSKLQEQLQTASLIKDTKNREIRMEELKRKIDQVHSDEIKFLIEQGMLLANDNKFGEAVSFIDKTLDVIELIDSPLIRDKEKINVIDAILKIGNQTAELSKFDYAFMDYDKTLELVELIEDSGMKNNEKLKIIEIYTNQLNQKAEIELNEGNFIKCIEYCQRAIKLDENYLYGYFTQGVAYLNKEQYDEAIKSFNKVIELDPNHKKSWKLIGRANELKSDLNSAISAYSNAINLDDSYNSGWYHKGNAFKKLKDHNNAIECYKKATELNPSKAKTWFFMGSVYYDLKDYDTAFEYIEKAIELDASLGENVNAHLFDFKAIREKLRNSLLEEFENRT